MGGAWLVQNYNGDLPTSGDRPFYGALVERRDGPSWLRDDDDDDDDDDETEPALGSRSRVPSGPGRFVYFHTKEGPKVKHLNDISPPCPRLSTVCF